MTTTLDPGLVKQMTRRVVRALQAATGMSNPALARQLHIAESTLATRLNGSVAFTSTELYLLAQLFAQDVNAFYTGAIDLMRIPDSLFGYDIPASDQPFCAAA